MGARVGIGVGIGVDTRVGVGMGASVDMEVIPEVMTEGIAPLFEISVHVEPGSVHVAESVIITFRENELEVPPASETV